MIINSSAVGMTSNRSYTSTASVKSASIITTAQEAEDMKLNGSTTVLSSSDSTKSAGSMYGMSGSMVSAEQSHGSTESAVQQLSDAEKQTAKTRAKEQMHNMAESVKDLMAANATNNGTVMKPEEDIQIKILKAMLKALNRYKKGNKTEKDSTAASDISTLTGLSSMKAAYGSSKISVTGFNLSILAGGDSSSASGSTGATVWKRTTAESAFLSETETTQFSAGGVAVTADGRAISFGVNVEMSRSFTARFDSFSQQDYVCTDPLVINLDAGVSGVTDQKFFFDLDSDGKQEEMSFAGQGSGFLALDKNGDGVINNGNELFGTKSGDGFADLAAYDQDGNGWIDEADDVFSKLKIWTKDENGKDSLISLKDAGVGALYLGSTDTEFSLKDGTTGATNGIVRKTGVYLKENGQSGTLQHVDLTT